MVRMWDAKARFPLLTREVNVWFGGNAVAFSPDGRRLAAGTLDNLAKVWDVETRREPMTFKGHTGPVSSVAFSPDGKRLATGSCDSTARIWDAVTGRELLIFKGGFGRVDSLAFSPDGRRLVTSGGGAKVWDAETGRELLTLKLEAGSLGSVAFSPDGRRIATATSSTAIIWSSFPWRDEDLPGDPAMSQDERVRLYKLDRGKKREEAVRNITAVLEQLRVGQAKLVEDGRAMGRREEFESCAANLRKIHAAFLRYRADHNNQMPDWLSDLVPQYLTSSTLLCPHDLRGQGAWVKDPKTSCSYTYDFSAQFHRQTNAKYGKTYRDWKTKQMEEFGDIVPTICCFNHGQRVLYLSYGGKIYTTAYGPWESLPREDYDTTATSPQGESRKQK